MDNMAHKKVSIVELATIKGQDGIEELYHIGLLQLNNGQT
jgi:hypothetical protein